VYGLSQGDENARNTKLSIKKVFNNIAVKAKNAELM